MAKEEPTGTVHIRHDSRIIVLLRQGWYSHAQQHLNKRQIPIKYAKTPSTARSYRTQLRTTIMATASVAINKMKHYTKRTRTQQNHAQTRRGCVEQEQSLVCQSRHLTWSEVLRELIEEPKEHCFGKSCRQHVLQTWQPERPLVQLR